MFGGMLFFWLVVTCIPEPDLGGHAHGSVDEAEAVSKAKNKRMLLTGVIAAVGISLHNFPEGLVVYNATIAGVCEEGSVDWSAGACLRSAEPCYDWLSGNC